MSELKKRLKKKTTWLALFAVIALLVKAFGWHLPDNWDGLVNGVLTVLAAFGVINDPLTEDDLCEKFGICKTDLKGGK